ncbi:hypothetical protein D3C85_1443960 [compost metagenome]
MHGNSDPHIPTFLSLTPNKSECISDRSGSPSIFATNFDMSFFTSSYLGLKYSLKAITQSSNLVDLTTSS